MRPTWIEAVAVAAVAAGVLAGIYLYEPTADAAEGEPSALEIPAGIDLTDAEGNPASLPLGERPFLVNFWATWCPPCRHELPILSEYAAQCPDRVYGIVVDSRQPAVELIEELDLKMENVFAGLDGGSKILEEFGNGDMLMPYSVVLDRSAVPVETKVGVFADVGEIAEFLALAPDHVPCPA